MTSYKPTHYNSVSVYLVTRQAAAVIEFMENAFDGRVRRRFEDDTGRIEHAEVQIDDTIVMVGDPGPGGPEQTAVLHVYVPDVDATYQKALAAGATGIQTPVQKGDPDKRGGVEDPAGNTWWVSTQMEQDFTN